MEVTSKFRTLYIAKYVFLFSIVFGIILASSFYTTDKLGWQGFLLISLVPLAIAVPTSMEFFALSRITISPIGIENFAIFTKKKTIIPYADIESFGSMEVNSSRRGDSYIQTVVHLKNGSMLVISPDCYENYPDLNRALLENYHKD